MKTQFMMALLATTALVYGGGLRPAYAAAGAVSIDADDIGGRVTGAKGPEAGVWVIAESRDLPTRFIKMAVTDDEGRYVVPDLPKGKYKVWVRGYGLVDSKPVDATPGATIDLKAVTAPDAKSAAQYYPANYWYALIGAPPASDFPGTGPKGNGISPSMKNQQAWLSSQKGCVTCHQWGDPAMRLMPETGNGAEAWAERIAKFRQPGDPTYGNHSQSLATGMINGVTSFGRQRALQLFADWTDKIRNGALPPETPPRPSGKERNVVVSIWDWGDQQFSHDIVSTDRRNPSQNSQGTIYGVDLWNSIVLQLDPKTGKTSQATIPQSFTRSSNTMWGPGGPMPHNPMLDQKGRVWMTDLQPVVTNAPFCADEKTNKFAKMYPTSSDHNVHMYDPKTGKMTGIPACFGSHHVAFGNDKDNTVYFSGDVNVAAWINTRVFDETGDASKAMGWCPLVLDTNGDGKIEPDRTKWNQPAGGRPGAGEIEAAFSVDAGAKKEGDKGKDTRISGFLYGLNVSPKDGSIWYAKTSPALPGSVIRFVPGNNPPETCISEVYEPPLKSDGTYEAFGTRGVDVDSNGIVWTSHASGNIGRFDRSKCKVLNGPTATGQQCPEGWTIYEVPGPKIVGTKVSTDLNYLAWVDLFDTFGLGKDAVFVPGSNSDSLIALAQGSTQPMTLRVPYPMGYFARGLDGRIDNTGVGWKGRGIWSNFGTVPVDHQEDGAGDTSKVVHFQLRPDPLAH